MFSVRYSRAYEENPFAVGSSRINGSSADFAFMLLFGGSVMIVSLCVLRETFIFLYSQIQGIGYVMDLMLLGPALVFMVLYVWSRKNPTAAVSFFGFNFQGIHWPWVLLGMYATLYHFIPHRLLRIPLKPFQY
jgi:Derlin-2/3